MREALVRQASAAEELADGRDHARTDLTPPVPSARLKISSELPAPSPRRAVTPSGSVAAKVIASSTNQPISAE